MESNNYNNYFKSRKVLVTGGAGFIGSHLTQHLVRLGASVHVLDDLSTGFRSNLSGYDIDFTHGSILDPMAVRNAIHGCSHVFHEAAFVSVPDSFKKEAQCLNINVVGTGNVLLAASNEGCDRVVFASSAACYGSNPPVPSKESVKSLAESPYAQSKSIGEQCMRDSDVDTVSLRYFNVFGERQNPKSQYAAVISAFTDAIMNNRKPIIFGDGTQSRDFTHVDNIVHANLLAASHPNQLEGDVFNVGTGTTLTLLDVLQIMVGHKELEIDFQPTRKGDVTESCADIRKIIDIFGYLPTKCTVDALHSLVNPKQH